MPSAILIVALATVQCEIRQALNQHRGFVERAARRRLGGREQVCPGRDNDLLPIGESRTKSRRTVPAPGRIRAERDHVALAAGLGAARGGGAQQQRGERNHRNSVTHLRGWLSL